VAEGGEARDENFIATSITRNIAHVAAGTWESKSHHSLELTALYGVKLSYSISSSIPLSSGSQDGCSRCILPLQLSPLISKAIRGSGLVHLLWTPMACYIVFLIALSCVLFHSTILASSSEQLPLTQDSLISITESCRQPVSITYTSIFHELKSLTEPSVCPLIPIPSPSRPSLSNSRIQHNLLLRPTTLYHPRLHSIPNFLLRCLSAH
jgi:hypothetical protein